MLTIIISYLCFTIKNRKELVLDVDTVVSTTVIKLECIDTLVNENEILCSHIPQVFTFIIFRIIIIILFFIVIQSR